MSSMWLNTILLVLLLMVKGCQPSINVALYKRAVQESVRNDSVTGFLSRAEYAVDGVTVARSNLPAGGCASTALNQDTDPWWMVDLGHPYSIDRIVIFQQNHSDKSQNRIRVGIGNQANVTMHTACNWRNESVPESAQITVICEEGKSGRYVSVQRAGGATDAPLELCEVQVLAEEAKVCGPIDLAFVVDNSDSIRKSNPEDGSYDNWERLLTFVAHVVERLPIGENDVRVGCVSYSGKAELEFHLDQYYDKQDLISAIYNITYIGAITNTAAGILMTRTEIFDPYRSGKRGDRADAPNVAIVITDGTSNYERELILPYASDAKNDNITILAVGITDKINETELSSISHTGIEGETYWKSADYVVRDTVVEKIVNQTCELSKKECADGFYGDGCLLSCYCRQGAPCDRETGACPAGCQPAYAGPSCSIRLPELMSWPRITGRTSSTLEIEFKQFKEGCDSGSGPVGFYHIDVQGPDSKKWRKKRNVQHDTLVDYQRLNITNLHYNTDYNVHVTPYYVSNGDTFPGRPSFELRAKTLCEEPLPVTLLQPEYTPVDTEAVVVTLRWKFEEPDGHRCDDYNKVRVHVLGPGTTESLIKDVYHVCYPNNQTMVTSRPGKKYTLTLTVFNNMGYEKMSGPFTFTPVLECEDGTFGLTCMQYCHCAGGKPCDKVTGRCPDGCDNTHVGVRCHIRLPELKSYPTIGYKSSTTLEIHFRQFFNESDIGIGPVGYYIVEMKQVGNFKWKKKERISHNLSLDYQKVNITDLDYNTEYRVRVRPWYVNNTEIYEGLPSFEARARTLCKAPSPVSDVKLHFKPVNGQHVVATVSWKFEEPDGHRCDKYSKVRVRLKNIPAAESLTKDVYYLCDPNNETFLTNRIGQPYEVELTVYNNEGFTSKSVTRSYVPIAEVGETTEGVTSSGGAVLKQAAHAACNASGVLFGTIGVLTTVMLVLSSVLVYTLLRRPPVPNNTPTLNARRKTTDGNGDGTFVLMQDWNKH